MELGGLCLKKPEHLGLKKYLPFKKGIFKGKVREGRGWEFEIERAGLGHTRHKRI